MITLKSARNACLFVLIINPLIACSQQGVDLEQLNAHIEVAELYREQGQFRASIIELQNAFQLAPDSVEAMRLLAQLYLEIGDVPSAIEQLSGANESSPNDPETILLLAEAYIASGKSQEASALLNELELPVDADIAAKNQKSLLLAQFNISDKNLEKATPLLNSILSSGGDSTEALILLSKIAYQAGNVDSSSSYTDQAIEQNPGGSLNLWIWRGQFALLQQDYPSAETAFYEALDIMSLYDIMTSKKFTVLQSVLIPLQMQQKNEEALRFSALIASTPQGELNSTYSNALSVFQGGDMAEAERAFNELLALAPNHAASNILLGVTKYAQGNYSEAAVLFDNFVDVESASPQLIKTLAATHLKLNDPEKALSILNEAMKNYPDDPSLVAAAALSYQALGRSEEAVTMFEKALETQPDSPSMHLALATNYIQLQNFPAAIESLNRVIELTPDSIQAKSSLMDIYIRQNQPDLARSQLQTWLEQDPDSVLNNSLAGLIAYQYESYDEARDYFTKVLNMDESNIQVRLNLARVDFLQENFQEAEENYNYVLEQDVNNVTALSAILALGERANNSEASIASLQTIIEDNPSEFTSPLVLSQYFLQSNQLDRAMEYAEVAYSRENNAYTQNALVDINSRLARASVQNEDFQQAQTFIEKIQEIQPAAASSYEIEGDFLMSRNETDSAINAYQQAWDLEASSGLGVKIYRLYSLPEQDQDASGFLNDWIALQPNEPSANLLMALEYQGKNQESDAINHYELVYQQQPDNLIMLNNLAWLYKEIQPERALELSVHAVELYPENADVLDTYGWILVQQDKQAEAIEILEKALALAPDSEEIIEHLNSARAGQ